VLVYRWVSLAAEKLLAISTATTLAQRRYRPADQAAMVSANMCRRRSEHKTPMLANHECVPQKTSFVFKPALYQGTTSVVPQTAHN
jgi:hypothetical protein